jgi:hypothetical protein
MLRSDARRASGGFLLLSHAAGTLSRSDGARLAGFQNYFLTCKGGVITSASIKEDHMSKSSRPHHKERDWSAVGNVVLFLDMHSGGRTKEEPFDKIYIECDNEDEAKIIFYNIFGHNPERVTCTCCGEDYSINPPAPLAKATGFHRGCAWNDAGSETIEKPVPRGFKKYQTLDEYMRGKRVLFIGADEITPDMREGEVPEQGYVWR